MERVLQAARDRGVVIIHAPSSCMDAYKDHPARKHADRDAPLEGPPEARSPRGATRSRPRRKGPTRSTRPTAARTTTRPSTRSGPTSWTRRAGTPGRPGSRRSTSLTIADRDYISDDGEEIWSILEDRGIKNVVLMGVHLNMCVLGRPFGLRQMAKNGKTVVLMRDLTDTMYNPAAVALRRATSPAPT